MIRVGRDLRTTIGALMHKEFAMTPTYGFDQTMADMISTIKSNAIFGDIHYVATNNDHILMAFEVVYDELDLSTGQIVSKSKCSYVEMWYVGNVQNIHESKWRWMPLGRSDKFCEESFAKLVDEIIS